jgi:hypothetical protein
MSSDERRARYLAMGPDDPADRNDRLDLIRDVLGGAATWAEPPPAVLDGALSALAPHETASELETSPRWPLVAALIGSAAAVAALVFASIAVIDANPVGDTILAMTGTGLGTGAGGTAAVHPTESGWWIRLDLQGLPPAPTGSYYEGWVWSDDGEGISIGSFHNRGGDDPVILWSGVELAEYPSIWVTLEPEDGVAAASGEVVMKGRMPA